MNTQNECPQCTKRRELCICEEIKTLGSRLHVLILQHPQEPDHDLGTARIANLVLKNSTLKVGLSWPNLFAALGRKDTHPSKWAVLYLGSGIKKADLPRTDKQAVKLPHLQLVTKQGLPLPDAEKISSELEGIVVLDGTWSQAKAIWWRNPWLLKLRRGILKPARRSLYKELRKEPRRECLSTIESIAASLTALGEPSVTETALLGLFEKLLVRYKEWRGTTRATQYAPKRTT